MITGERFTDIDLTKTCIRKVLKMLFLQRERLGLATSYTENQVPSQEAKKLRVTNLSV